VLAAKSVRLSSEWRGFFRRLAVNYAGCRHYHAVGFQRRLDRDHDVQHIVGDLVWITTGSHNVRVKRAIAIVESAVMTLSFS
jgi:hypothetical protein